MMCAQQLQTQVSSFFEIIFEIVFFNQSGITITATCEGFSTSGTAPGGIIGFALNVYQVAC